MWKISKTHKNYINIYFRMFLVTFECFKNKSKIHEKKIFYGLGTFFFLNDVYISFYVKIFFFDTYMFSKLDNSLKQNICIY